MKRTILAPIGALILCSACVSAGVIPLTRDYTGFIESFFRTDDVLSLGATTTNGYIQAFDTRYPYAGGMGINNPEEMMSLHAIRIATLFVYTSVFKPKPECWGSGYVEGTIEVEPNAEHPIGTPLELQIVYSGEEVGTPSSYPLSKGAFLLGPHSEFLWYADYSTDGNMETHSVDIISGQEYYFYTWQNFGTQAHPVTSYAGSAVSIDFNVVPEPSSCLLFVLGAVSLTRRRKLKAPSTVKC